MTTSKDPQPEAQLQQAIAQADAALEVVQRMNAAVAGAEVAAIADGLQGIRQRAESRLQELQRQREELEAAARNKAEEEASKMTSRQTRGDKQAQIESISGELNTSLRLGRIDGAVKELLAFFEDQEFFAANATTARRRRLKGLQAAIEKALVK